MSSRTSDATEGRAPAFGQLTLTAASLGAVVLPTVAAFYHQPKTNHGQLQFTIGKVLASFQISGESFYRREDA